MTAYQKDPHVEKAWHVYELEVYPSRGIMRRITNEETIVFESLLGL